MGFYQPYSGVYSGVEGRVDRGGAYNVGRIQLREDEAPIVEPVSLAQAKKHLRVDFDDDDALITEQIRVARELVEKEANRALVLRTSTARIPYFADVIRLPFRPIHSVISIKYYSIDSPSTLETLYDVSTSPVVDEGVYALDLDEGVLLRNNNQHWPAVDMRYDAIQIKVQHGVAPDESVSPVDYTANVPAPLKQAVLLILGDLYENREEHTPLSMQRLPSLERIIRLYRQRR